LGTAASGTSTTTLALTPAATLEVGNVGILVISSDNINTGDGDFSEVQSVVDTQSNQWEKVGEQTNGQGAAAGGVTCSVWMVRPTTQLTTGSTITITFASAIVDKCASFWEFTVGAKLAVKGSTPNVTDGSNGFGSAQISSLPSQSYLFFRGLAKEANSTTNITVTTNYTAITAQRSRNNAAATLVRGEFRIVTATTETSNPTLAVSGDTAAVFVALAESAGAMDTAMGRGIFRGGRH
jgi:hypothetical protein